MNDQTIEQEIQAKGLTAARVTPADIEANIASEFYFTAGQGVLGESEMGTRPAGIAESLNLLTFCVLVLRNGFTVTGESACASPENFDAELGRKIARQNAVQKIWPLMGYALKEQLAAEARGDINHDIGWAVRQAKLGKKVARAGWNGRGLCVIFYVPSEENVIPHLRLRYPDGMYVSWAPSSTDSVMQDWEIVS